MCVSATIVAHLYDPTTNRPDVGEMPLLDGEGEKRVSEKGTAVLKYQGVDVTVDSSGRFCAKIEDVEICEDTYEAAKKKIDKEFSAEVVRIKKQKLSLKVAGMKFVKLGSSRYADKKDLGPTRGTLVSVNRTTCEFQYEGIGKTEGFDYVVPDTEENFALLTQLHQLERETKRISILLSPRKLTIGGFGYGRIDATDYESVMKELRNSYATALKRNTPQEKLKI